MKRRLLWKVSVATSNEAENAVAALLSEVLGQPASSYRDLETGQTTVTAYLRKPPAASRGWRAELHERLRRAKACGLNVGRGRVSLASVRWEDWAESWKCHFKPMSFGSTLLVKPSWSRLEPRNRQALVVLDPGLSFGTGQHPTTAFCLRQIVKQRSRGQNGPFLDIGTGSGILAIAAARLGFNPVHAFDVDPEAIRIARANARQNGVASQVRLSRRDLAKNAGAGGGKYSMICANLEARLLLAERKRILAWLQPGGLLVVAGILDAEFGPVRAAYEAAGLRLAESRTQGEWQSAVFSRERPAEKFE